MGREEENYRERTRINREKAHKKGLFFVFSFFAIVALCLALGIFWAKKSLNANDLSFWKSEKGITLDTLLKRGTLENSPTVSININEQELAGLLRVGTDEFPLKKSKLSISENNIKISGKTGLALFSMGVDFYFKPKVAEDKLVFSLDKVETGGVPAPQKITSVISPKIEDIFLKQLPINDQTKVTATRLGNGFMVVEGTKK